MGAREGLGARLSTHVPERDFEDFVQDFSGRDFGGISGFPRRFPRAVHDSCVPLGFFDTVSSLHLTSLTIVIYTIQYNSEGHT